MHRLFVGVVARYTSGVTGTGPADMQVVAINGGVPHDAVNSEETPTGQDGRADPGFGKGGIVVWLNEAFSTGHLAVSSPDSWTDPTIEENMLSDSRDLERLRTQLSYTASLMLAWMACQFLTWSSSISYKLDLGYD